ncbi:dCTP deaminase [Candidatus Nomurabacteria bacterium]|nr:dCTP deaminase [Candidatus Nomurabacteria bacterium]
MFLVDKDIKREVEVGNITLEPFDEERLQPASYDILLGNKFMLHDSHDMAYIDPVKKEFANLREVEIPDDGKFILHPGLSVIGFSHDYFGSDKFLIQLGGKSSLARIGLMIHNTAGIINPGHRLNVAFELSNTNNIPIILRPKMAIGQITFSTLSSDTEQHYKDTGRYHDNNWNAYVPHKNDK